METKDLKITVIGTGNAGLTAAYHLTSCGNQVCLYGAAGFDEQLDMISDKGGITALAELNGVNLPCSGFEKIDTLTRDIQEAAAFSKILFMPVPSFAQEPLFKAMLPYLTNQHVLFLLPGNYGSLALTKLKDELGFGALDLTFVDAISIPWACRITGDAEIAIFGLKEHLPVAALPASRTAAAIAMLEGRFPLPLTALGNVLVAGLENINFGAHPLMTTLNMGLLENFNGKFNYYKDCCSKSTARVVAVMEEERLAVGRALGFALKPELEMMNDLYGLQCKDVYEVNRSSETHGKLTGAPNSSDHRYITEDVPFLLVPCYEFAQLGGVKTPILEACLNIAKAFNGTDYFVEGRTLEKMGLDRLEIGQIPHSIEY